uniref:Uncharacterized protein n=1 Tax=Tetranychus urticae TaxID=32264 RepID=T1JPY7_TETUR
MTIVNDKPNYKQKPPLNSTPFNIENIIFCFGAKRQLWSKKS